MRDKKIGFIGGGNMGSAIIGGILSSGLSDAAHIMASAKTSATRANLEKKYGITTSASNLDIASECDIIFLAVKPYVFDTVIPEIKDVVTEDKLIISIAAGKTLSQIEDLFGHPVKIIRTMPNTPALVGEAMSALTANTDVLDEEMDYALTLFESFGQAEVISESLMDVVTGVSGSSPAYVYLFIEAMADAAVADGMPRAQAYKFAAQAVLGSAKMVLETGTHPGALKDAVCSPGGTTIEAVATLEEKGLRNAVIAASRSCTAKSRKMSK